MSTESLPHQIDQATPVSAFLGTENEAHGGEVSAALQDWIQRAMDALAAVGPPPLGVVHSSVPTQTLPALGEVTLEVEPSNIDTNNPLANPRRRREIIRAAFDYALAPPQTTSHSSEDRLDRRADTPMDVPGDPSEDRPGCTSNVNAPAGPVAADSPHPEPFPSPHNVSPHSSPTPTAGVIPTPPMLPTSNAVVDLAMADRSQNAIGDEGQQAIQATMTSISNDHHRDGQGEHNGDADKANAIEVRTTDALQQDASISISQYEIKYARAERERQEMKRRIAEDRQRAWAKDATTSRRDATTARKGATPRKDARAEEHKSRAPKTRRQASPLPALLSRLRDPPQNVCSYNSELDDPQLPSTPIHSPRDRSPTPSTPPPSQYAGLPLVQRLSADPGHPGPLFDRIGPPVDESNSTPSSERAVEETRGRRTTRAPGSTEPSLSRNGALPRALPTRKAEKAPAAAASAHIASTASRTVSSTGTRKTDGVRNSEQRLESASQRPATLASSAPGVTGISKLVVDEGRASGKAGSSDAMASIVPRTATTTVSPQIVTPPPTHPTPNPGPLPPPADRASSSTGVHPQSPHKRSYEELVTELLSSHSTRAPELAPAPIQFTITPTSPGGRAAPVLPTSTVPDASPAAHSSHAPTLMSSATSSVTSNCSPSPRVDSSELGEYIFSLPVDNSVPVTMKPVKTGEQSYGPLKMDEDMDEPMKVDEDTGEPIQGEEEELAMKTENEVTSKTEEVKDVLVPVEPAPRYEPRALVPKLRQHSAVSPSIGTSHSQSFWIEMPPRTLPQESYLLIAQDEQQPLIPPPEQALRRSTRSTSSANSVRMAASAIVQLSPASAQSFSVPAQASSTAAATGPSSAPTNAIPSRQRLRSSAANVLTYSPHALPMTVNLLSGQRRCTACCHQCTSWVGITPWTASLSASDKATL
ncbi:hypothetical protein FB107DRAFT_294339 [Schizophyllum commune]